MLLMEEIKMNELIEVKNVRGYIDDKGIAWLNLEDVAKGLGFTEKSKSGNTVVMWRRVRQYLKDLKVIDTSADGVGKENLPEYIQENVFYKLCMKANNEVARKFQDRVCDEILPMIRKTGMYMTDNVFDAIMQNPEKIGQFLIEYGKTRKENEKLILENKEKDKQITELKPAKEYVDKILSTEDTMTITQIAADYGLSGLRLNQILHQERIIRNVGGQWLLYMEHMNKGYTKSETIAIKKKDGSDKVITATKWTQKGRLKIHQTLTELGILVNVDKEKKFS
jgi:Uncharacterized phage-encoded protein